jgi:hypothetical protein
MSRARLCQPRETLVPALLDLIARRPELRDVGIAGYLVESALNDEGGAIRGWRWYLAFQDVDKRAA